MVIGGRHRIKIKLRSMIFVDRGVQIDET